MATICILYSTSLRWLQHYNTWKNLKQKTLVQAIIDLLPPASYPWEYNTNVCACKISCMLGRDHRKFQCNNKLSINTLYFVSPQNTNSVTPIVLGVLSHRGKINYIYIANCISDFCSLLLALVGHFNNLVFMFGIVYFFSASWGDLQEQNKRANPNYKPYSNKQAKEENKTRKPLSTRWTCTLSLWTLPRISTCWTMLAKADCPKRFVKMTCLFHYGITSLVLSNGVSFNSSEISNSKKQGYMLAL